MAAIDPNEETEGGSGSAPSATLRLIRRSILSQARDETDEDDDDDTFDSKDMQRLLNGDADGLDDDSDSADYEEINGGPSDPAKAKKVKQEAKANALAAALKNGDEGDSMELDGPGKKNKGKGKAMVKVEDDDDEDSDDESLDSNEIESFVLCTLNPLQQPLDIVINEDEETFFAVSGTHTVYLTGNHLMHEGPDADFDGSEASDEDDLDYADQIPLDELEDELDEDESDALDDVDDPRITELGSDGSADELAPPQLVGKKRPAASDSESEDLGEPVGLDDVIAKSLQPAATAAPKDEVAAAATANGGEQKLSKKQRKKLKNQQGKAAAAPQTPPATVAANGGKKESTADTSAGKKVQFADKLEQGPTPKKAEAKTEAKTEAAKPDAGKAPAGGAKPNVRTVSGVTIDDRKLGTGQKAKKGSKLGLRYIGKLTDGKVFDANKKGKPFTVKVGAGEVIKGWDVGLEGLAAGGERKLTIPAHMAYGNKSLPGIPANSQLVFDVKCLSVS